jgi:hypothetical protein
VAGTHTSLGGNLRSAIARLAIKVLRRASNLIGHTFCLSFGISGHTAKSFLHFSACVPNRALYSIFIHLNVSSGGSLTQRPAPGFVRGEGKRKKTPPCGQTYKPDSDASNTEVGDGQ